MASETLGSVALLDPAIKLGRKVWRTYKLQATFGEDFKDYANHFLSEGVLLDELLKTPILLLDDHETQTEFSTALQEVGSSEDLRQLLHRRPDEFQKARMILSELVKLSSLFEKCAELIDRYLPQPDATQGLSRDESNNSGGRTPQSSSDISLDPNIDAQNSQTSNASLGPARRKHRSLKSSLRRSLHRWHKDSTSHVPSPVGEPSIGPERLNHQDVQVQSALERLQSLELQRTVSVGRRVQKWVLKDRDDFIRLIREIQESNRFLERLVTITDIRQRTNSVEPSTSTSHIPPDNEAAPCLAVLATVLREASGPPEKRLLLQMKDNYKKYAEEAQSDNAYLLLASGTFMFPIKVYFPGTSSDSISQIHTSVYRSSEVLIAIKQGFEVGNTLPDTETKWEFSSEFPGGPHASAHYYQNQALLCLDQHIIRILQHYPEASSFMTRIDDMLMDVELRQDKELVGFRYHLAYKIAAFFSTSQTSVGSHDLFVFFETRPSEMDSEDRVNQLTAPYLEYGKPDPSATGSLHVSRTPQQSVSVQKLGILMHEIGSWTPIVTPGQDRPRLNKAIDTAKANAVKSRNALGLQYYNVLQECLNWPENFPANGFQERVLTPLNELKSKYVLPPDEKY